MILCCFAMCVLIALMPALRVAAGCGSSREVSMTALGYMSGGDSIIAFRDAPSGLPFYFGHRIAVACNLDTEADGKWFINSRQLRRLWNGAERILLTARREDTHNLRSALGREPVRLCETSRYILFTNF